MLIIRPLGGLANRLRALASALTVQDLIGCELDCIWQVDDELGAPFGDVFQSIEGLRVRHSSGKFQHARVTHGRSPGGMILSRGINLILTGLDVVIDERICGWRQCQKLSREEALNAMRKQVLITTYQDFLPFRPGLQKIKLLCSLQEKVSRQMTVRKSGSPLIGVHVRRGDNGPATSQSPTHLFVSHMRAALQSNPNSTFFLATDSRDVEIQLATAFPGKIAIPARVHCRSSTEGIQDAALDLFSLACCDQIIGSYWSSFSLLAAEIGGGIPLKIIRSSECS